MGVDEVLDIKRELYGSKRRLNDLDPWELNQLLVKLRREHATRSKRKKLH